MHNPPKDPCIGCTSMLTHRHTMQQHHTACDQTIHTHTPQQLAKNQPTNQPTNHPTNQRAKLSCATTNQPKTNQSTQQPTKQPENQQPTNQKARYQCTRRGDSITWDKAGQSIPMSRTEQCIAQLEGRGGGGKGGGMVGTGDLYTTQPHATVTDGREEGRSNTPTSWFHYVPVSSPQSKQAAHLRRGNGYPRSP